jgi:hypothetical protein
MPFADQFWVLEHLPRLRHVCLQLEIEEKTGEAAYVACLGLASVVGEVRRRLP